MNVNYNFYKIIINKIKVINYYLKFNNYFKGYFLKQNKFLSYLN